MPSTASSLLLGRIAEASGRRSETRNASRLERFRARERRGPRADPDAWIRSRAGALRRIAHPLVLRLARRVSAHGCALVAVAVRRNRIPTVASPGGADGAAADGPALRAEWVRLSERLRAPRGGKASGGCGLAVALSAGHGLCIAGGCGSGLLDESARVLSRLRWSRWRRSAVRVLLSEGERVAVLEAEHSVGLARNLKAFGRRVRARRSERDFDGALVVAFGGAFRSTRRTSGV